MSNSIYAAADFITDLGFLNETGEYSPIYRILLRDMADILDKVNLYRKPNSELSIVEPINLARFILFNGVYFREYNGAVLIREEWDYSAIKVLNEKDLPSLVNYYLNGNIKKQEWLNDRSSIHNSNDKPAVVGYHENGKIKYEHWVENGLMTRGHGKPAGIFYDKNGNKEKEEYWVKGDPLGNYF